MVTTTTPELAVGDSLRIARIVVDEYRSSIPRAVREELTQEAAFRAWRGRSVRHRRAYVRQTARNLALDWLRHSKVVQAHIRQPATVSYEAPLDARLDVSRAMRLLDEAPDGYRVVVRLFIDDVKPEELAEEAVGPRRHSDPKVWRRAVDLVYKRRARSLKWLRKRLASNARARGKWSTDA